MVRFQDLKPGDFVIASFDGEKWEGTVKELNREDKEVCVETGVQEFWFKPEDLHGIPLDDEQLVRLGFIRQPDGNESIKYLKGAFRVFLPRKDDFSNLEIWYREDRRSLHQPITVHELQNHYNQMTKVDLTRN
jgi:hypothetical protein